MNSPIDKHNHDDRDAFVSAAESYICEGLPASEWSAQQHQAMRIVESLGLIFAGSRKPQLWPDLARAAAVLSGERTLIEKRVHAMNDIAETASGVRPITREMVATDGMFERAIRMEVSTLTFYLGELDEAFAYIRDDFESCSTLLSKLLAYRERSKGIHGAKNAARILAELIVDANGALGIEVNLDASNEDTDEDEIERVRKILQRDFDKLQTSIKTAVE